MRKLMTLMTALLLCVSDVLAVDVTPAVEVTPGVVQGKIMDGESKQAVAFATVVIKAEAKMIGGATTDAEGKFYIHVPEGRYTLEVSYVGYKKVTRPFIMKSGRGVNLGVVLLTESGVQLQEASVKGQKSHVKLEIDKKVFNVDQNIANTGGSASEVLENIPSVEISSEGEVSLRGNTSVTVWINGKASGLTVDNQAQILEQIPAENIERIEVITNPSAKYSSEGTAGIINIVLKAGMKAGYYGSAQIGGDIKGGYNAGLSINYNVKKWETFASVGYRSRKREQGGATHRTNTDGTVLHQEKDAEGRSDFFFGRAGATLHATPKDQFSLSGMGMIGDRDNTTLTRYTSNMPHTYLSSVRTAADDNTMAGGSLSFDYQHDFGENHNLMFNATYNRWGGKSHSIYEQRSHYANNLETSSYQRQHQKVNSSLWELSADYTNQLNKNQKIEAGFETTLSRDNGPVQTWGGTSAATATETKELYNRFLYEKDIHALYATYSGKIDRLGYQAGVRGEYSRVETRSLGYGENKQQVAADVTDYLDLFPSVFLSYNLPKNNELQVNYSRRIARPWGRNLNSFQNITDSTNISYGNPLLKPQYSNAFELNYIKTWEDHVLSFSGYYRTTDDVIQRISYLDQTVMKTTYDNIAQTISAGVEIIGKNKLFRLLDLTTTVNVYYYKLDGFHYQPIGAIAPVVGRAQENVSWNVRMLASLMLPHSYTLQLTGNYNSRQAIAQGIRRSNCFLDAGIRKKIKNFSISLSGRDLFASRKFKNRISGNGYMQESETWRGGRNVSLTVAYNFGNMKAKKKAPKKQDVRPSASDEQSEGEE
ncbi:MAG: TonB-dependent receptor [Bacteroidaceae bacterium]